MRTNLLPWLAAPAALLVLGAGAARGCPLISELLYDAVGGDDGGVFVELYGEPGTSLEGLVLEGVNGANGSVGPSLTLSGTLPADGFFVVADAADGVTRVPEADLVLDFDFQNGPDSVRLRSGDEILDAVGYGVFDPGEVFAGEGEPAPDAPPGSSLARRFADLDTDDNAGDFVVLSEPTPGTGELQPVPEPGSAALVAAGLLLLAARRRGGGGEARRAGG